MALVKCGECGKEISDKSAACVSCGAPVTTINQTQPISDSNEHFAKLDDDLRAEKEFFPHAWESIIAEATGAYIKSAINVDVGKITLTNRRVVFCGDMGTYTKLAIFGALALLGAGKAPKIHFQVILDDLAKLEIVKHGFSKAYLATTKDGKKFKFQVGNMSDSWIDVFSNAGITVHQQ